MLDSAKIYRMELPYDAEQLEDAMLEIVRVNSVAEPPACQPVTPPAFTHAAGFCGRYPGQATGK
jgi:hypothetical protein